MKTISTQKGFTIVETLVAVAILMIAIAGPLTIAQKGLVAALDASDQVTAAYLAQDATEFIKNIRDNNIISSRSWLDKLTGCDAGTRCRIDTIVGNTNAAAGNTAGAGIVTCSPAGTSCILYLLEGTGYLHNGSGVATKYSRNFYITSKSNNPDEARLTVEISWRKGTLTNVVTYETEIFNILR